MGSLLTSIRGETSLLWLNPKLILDGKSRYLELNHEGTSDGSPMVHAMPFSLEKLTYLKMAVTLRREALLFEFPYDWRLQIERNADYLARSIESLGRRRRHHAVHAGGAQHGRAGGACVCQRRPGAGAAARQARDHAGHAAFWRIGRGVGHLQRQPVDGHRQRARTATTTCAACCPPSPAPSSCCLRRPIFSPSGRPYPLKNFDVYDERAWRMASVRQDFLDGGKRLHELLAGDDHPVPTIQIAGCHMETITDVEMQFDRDDRPRLDIVRTKTGADSGDATVPLWSARLPGAEMYYVQEVHRDLPKNSDVIDAVLDLTYGRVPDLPDTLPEPKGGLFGSRPVTGSPEMEAQKLRQRLEDGTATEEDMQKLFFFDG